MGYPNPPNARSGDPGSLWWFDTASDGTRWVYETQWDVLVRMFQNKAARLLPAAYFFPANGQCGSIPHIVTSNWRRTDHLVADGIFGPGSRDALGFLLCATDNSDRALRLAQETAQGVISDYTIAEIVWFTWFVTSIGTFLEPSVEYTQLGDAIEIQPTTVLPAMNLRVASAQEDLAFWDRFRPGTDAMPLAPSQRAALAAQGTPPPAGTPPPGTSPPGAPPVSPGTPAPGGVVPAGQGTAPPAPGYQNTMVNTGTTAPAAAATPWYENGYVIAGAIAVVAIGGGMLLMSQKEEHRGGSGRQLPAGGQRRYAQLPAPRRSAGGHRGR
jgi:hypothetical protein